MSFIAAKCTQCGGILEVDSSQDAAICKFCKMPFVIEKAINNYNVTNNINASAVNIFNNQKDFEIRAGVLIKYNGEATEVDIPDGLTGVGDKAFLDCVGLTKVTIPNSVTYIGDMAFRGCINLKEIDLPDSVNTIIGYAFQYCTGLIRIKLPKGLERIADCTFLDCSKLEDVVLPIGMTSINKEAFKGTLFYSNYLRKKEAEQRAAEQRAKWKRQGLCQYCGNKLKFFKNECKTCYKMQ